MEKTSSDSQQDVWWRCAQELEWDCAEGHHLVWWWTVTWRILYAHHNWNVAFRWSLGANVPCEPSSTVNFKYCIKKLVGEKHLKLILERFIQGHPTNVMIDGIAFPTLIYVAGQMRQWKRWRHAAFKLDINEFRGNQSLQLMIDHIEAKWFESNGVIIHWMMFVWPTALNSAKEALFKKKQGLFSFFPAL